MEKESKKGACCARPENVLLPPCSFRLYIKVLFLFFCLTAALWTRRSYKSEEKEKYNRKGISLLSLEVLFLRISLLRSLLLVETGLLAVQFAVGVSISLFPIPAYTNFGLFSLTGTGLGVHHYISIFALILAAFVTALSFAMKNTLVSKLSIFGLALLIGAFTTGTAFVYLQKNSFYAIAMGVFFVLALIVYESMVFIVKN